MSENKKDVWFFAESDGAELREVVFELASEGRRLADKLKEKLCAVVLSGDPQVFSEQLSRFGVDTIYHVPCESGIEVYAQVLSGLIGKYNVRLLLMGATPMGSELASRVAAKSDIGIVTNCLIAELNDHGCFELTKMIYGDYVYSTVERPAVKALIVTTAPGSFSMNKGEDGKAPELVVEAAEAVLSSSRVRYLDFIKGDPKKIDVSEAEIIVAVGRGARDMEGLEKVERLAELIDGTIGGSRVAVDLRLVPYERQVGQTGKTVSPRVFICCGISGAFEFVAGMRESKLIAAINSDPKAPIFKAANLSLVGDLHEVVPLIVKKLETLSGGERK